MHSCEHYTVPVSACIRSHATIILASQADTERIAAYPYVGSVHSSTSTHRPQPWRPRRTQHSLRGPPPFWTRSFDKSRWTAFVIQTGSRRRTAGPSLVGACSIRLALRVVNNATGMIIDTAVKANDACANLGSRLARRASASPCIVLRLLAHQLSENTRMSLLTS